MSDEMMRLNSERERVQSLMEEIEKERELLQASIEHLTARISPIRCLPPEILAEIFGWVLSSDGWDLFLRLNRGPWFLGRICSQWRQVVNSSPQLWSNFNRIVYGVSSSEECCPIGAVDLLKTAISRCGSNTISFHLELDSRDHLDLKGSKAVLKELVRHSDRWKRAEFYNFDLKFIPLLWRIRGRLSSLETLIFSSSPYVIDPNSIPPLDAFEIAPMIREVQRNSIWFRLTLPFNQLTRYMGTYSDEKYSKNPLLDRLRILKKCPNLFHLQFPDRLPDKSAPTHAGPPIQHLSLRILQGCDHRFFDSLTLPELKELHIGTPENVHPKVYIAIHALLQRSACMLQKLSLLNIVDIPVVIDTLHNCPALTHLTLNFTGECGFLRREIDIPIGPLIHRLKASDGRSALLPRLEYLKIEIHPPDPATICIIDSAFCDFLENRWYFAANGMVTRLQKFELLVLCPPYRHASDNINVDLDSTVISRLIALKTEGLELSIVTDGEFPRYPKDYPCAYNLSRPVRKVLV